MRLVAKISLALATVPGIWPLLAEDGTLVDRLVAEWLDRYLRVGLQWPSLEPHSR